MEAEALNRAHRSVRLEPLYVFFFSSRRRHTRSTRDWSSDVCSSDLNRSIDRLRATAVMRRSEPIETAEDVRDHAPLAAERSEERRVGKECRCRWSPYHEKKQNEMIKKKHQLDNIKEE